MKISSISWLLVAGLSLVSVIVITSTAMNLSNTSSVQDIWVELDETRSGKNRALNALINEIGFGGMIHAFKNYLIRNQYADRQKLTENFGGAIVAINQYRSTGLSVTEEQAVNDIEKTIIAYRLAADKIDSMMAEKKYSIPALDKAAKVGDEEAIRGMSSLAAVIAENKYKTNSHENKLMLIQELKKSLGYGGLIHQFKNYLIRADKSYFDATIAAAMRINVTIKKYRQLDHTEDEKKALDAIKNTASNYTDNTIVIKNLHSQGVKPRDIDMKVRVNDRPVIDGLAMLTQASYLQNENSARELADRLDLVILINKLSSILVLVLMLLMVIVSFWVLRIKMIQPISKLTSAMTALSQGDYSVDVYGEGLENEIGEMAESIRVFKVKSLQRDEMEARLIDMNRELENRVSERTTELSNKREILKSVLDTAADAIITIDTKGIIQSFNAAAVGMFGYQAEQVTGQNIKMLMPDPYRAEHDEYLQHYMSTGKKNAIGSRSYVSGLRANLQTFAMELAVSEIDVGDEKIFTGIVRDLSETISVENKLRDAKEEAEKANQVKSEFLSSMSHELRTPLNSILGFTQILELDSEQLNETHLELIKEIKASGKHLLSLITEILDLVRIETGSYRLSLQSVSVDDVLNESIDKLRLLANEKNISIEKQKSDYQLVADPLRLQQVFYNLISNAIKYISRNGHIKIVYEKLPADWIRVAIVDDGPGLSEASLSRLFIPFERLDASCSDIEGTGIGLVACKRLVKLMNGNIGVESEETKGCKFWFELKIDSNETNGVSDIVDIQNENINGLESENDSEKYILYIEDNITNLKVVEKWIAKTTNYKLLSAKDATEGFAKLEERKPEIILLDINLPGIGGYEVLEIIRQNTDYDGIPVIAVTANAMLDEIERGMDAGFDSYITKPIDLDKLVRSIDRLLV